MGTGAGTPARLMSAFPLKRGPWVSPGASLELPRPEPLPAVSQERAPAGRGREPTPGGSGALAS